MTASKPLTVYRGCVPVVDAEYEVGDGRSPSETIVRALADAAGVDPLDIPPLFEYVDPDALNALFDRHGRAPDGDTLLSFQVKSWNVFVRSDGRVRVCDATQRIDPEPVFDPTKA